MNMRNTVQCSGSYNPAGGDEYDDHHPAGFFFALRGGERDEFCLHVSESTFCGFAVSIIELHNSYATVADVLSGEITKELAF